MAQLNVVQANTSGQVITLANADVAGDKFTNNGRVVLRVVNGGTLGITVTVDSKQKCSFGFDHDLSITVGAGEDMLIGPFDPQRFNDSEGNTGVSYSDVTSVQVAAIRI